jgi:cobalt/nickel transport system permease protein
VKLLTAVAFIVCVVSFPKHEVSGLMQFFLYPVMMAAVGGIPFGLVARKVIVVSPFALMVGAFNPFFDTAPAVSIGSVAISGGWLSFASIMIRFALTVSTAVILISTTSFHGVCRALEQLGAPAAFATQLLVLYRYLFVLGDESRRMLRAFEARSFGEGAPTPGMKTVSHLIGALFLRTVSRAGRIHAAMTARGFDGEMRTMRQDRIRLSDALFAALAISAFVVMRTMNIAAIAGSLVTEGAR